MKMNSFEKYTLGRQSEKLGVTMTPEQERKFEVKKAKVAEPKLMMNAGDAKVAKTSLKQAIDSGMLSGAGEKLVSQYSDDIKYFKE